MSEQQQLFLHDFFIAVPLPGGYTVESSELSKVLAKKISAEFKRTRSGKVYIRYPEFFGQEFSNVWFELSLLTKLSNHHLQALEYLLNDESENDRSFDEFNPKAFIVEGLEFPLRTYPLAEGIVGIS